MQFIRKTSNCSLFLIHSWAVELAQEYNDVGTLNGDKIPSGASADVACAKAEQHMDTTFIRRSDSCFIESV